jgi:formylglycine-generating enzyme required for sulfatase activity
MFRLFVSSLNVLLILLVLFDQVGTVYGQPSPPEGMVYIPGGEFHFLVYNRWREGLNNERFEMGPLGQWYITERMVNLKHYFMDKTEVTNAQFKKFLDATGYKPQHNDSFLKHWQGGEFSPDQANQPVVWIDLDDAKAYAQWAGKDIPTEEQWQMAAQGTDNRLYPWGNEYDLKKANVRSDGPKNASSFQEGASPYGCLNMVGNVWEWTDSKHDDGRHWYSYLRGGSWFQPVKSTWYTESGLITNFQRLKYWWLSPGLNRNETVGFRCVKNITTEVAK